MRTIATCCKIALFVVILFTGCNGKDEVEFEISSFRVENLDSPLGIPTANPSFSWTLRDERKSVSQSAWQLLIEDPNGKTIWNSGKQQNKRQFNISYPGVELKPNTHYGVKLIVWNNHREKAFARTTFHIGLLDQIPWKAQWIGASDINVRTPQLRGEFLLEKQAKSAFLYVTGLGYFECYLNGKKIGNQVLSPNPTQYQQRVQYHVFDVKELLNDKHNCLGIILGEAQAAGSVQDSTRFYSLARPYPGPFDAPRAIAQLMVDYTDGSQQIFVTDTTWQWSQGPITYNHFYGGEDYDARLEMDGWNTVDFDHSKWLPCIERQTETELSPTMVEPIRVIDVLNTKSSIVVNDSTLLFDLGQVIGGWWRLTVEGESGSKVRLRGAETVNNHKLPKNIEPGDVLSTEFSHGLGGFYERDAYSVYTLKGKGTETWEPRFYYGAFRYIEVVMSNPTSTKIVAVQGCTTHNDLEKTGTFESSDTVLNKLYENLAWTIKAIFQGAPMSNANSEKYGWTGDVHLFVEPTNMMFDARNFWKKWIADIRDAQLFYKTGNVISTVPNFRRDSKTTSATWGAAYPLTIWYNYLYYDDEKSVESHYEGVKAWVEHLRSQSRNNLVRGVWADHVPPGFDAAGNHIQRGLTPESSELIASVYYAVSTSILSEMARVSGRFDAYFTYRSLADDIKQAINSKYFDAEKGCYITPKAPAGYDEVQSINLIPLQHNIVPDSARKKVMEHVIANISSHNNHLMTGIMGTKAMVDVLPREGYSALLHTIATRETYPGWGYWIKNGATTFWQQWSGDPDHTHAMFGSIINFLVCNVAGISLPSSHDTYRAFKTIRFEPVYPDSISFARATIPSNYGAISFGWERTESGIKCDAKLPVGTEGHVYVPAEWTVVKINGQQVNRLYTDAENQQKYIRLSAGKFIVTFEN